jgi:hypothetical protein
VTKLHSSDCLRQKVFMWLLNDMWKLVLVISCTSHPRSSLWAVELNMILKNWKPRSSSQMILHNFFLQFTYFSLLLFLIWELCIEYNQIFILSGRSVQSVVHFFHRWPAACIHGDKSQPERDWVLQGKYLWYNDVETRLMDIDARCYWAWYCRHASSISWRGS